MKRNALRLLPIIFFVILVSSCTETYIITPASSMNFKFNIINSTDMRVDVRVLPVRFGVSGYDENIYINEEKYNEYFGIGDEPSVFPNRMEKLQEENYEEYIPGSNIYINVAKYASISESINAKNSCEGKDLKIRYIWEAMLIEIKFDNKEIRRLAGWPEYYNNKLDDVVKYGFFYMVDPDKKICLWREDDNHKDRAYYIFDENGEIISGYDAPSYKTYYPMTLKINSTSDITIEKGTWTGYEPGEYEEEYEEVICVCPLAPEVAD